MMLKYRWENYTKVGSALRRYSFAVMALHGCILSEIQPPPENRKVFNAELHGWARRPPRSLAELQPWTFFFFDERAAVSCFH